MPIMKIRLTFFASLIILLAIACKNSATTNTTTPTADTTSAAAAMTTTDTTNAMMVAPDSVTVYVCTMHPEVTGKKGDKCPKCKMELVAKADVKKADH